MNSLDQPANLRSVGVDFGSRRIGIAICDSDGKVATAHSTIKRVGDEQVEHQAILEVAEEIGATAIVIGLPIDLAGEHGPAARAVQSEARRLGSKAAKRFTSMPLHLHDERLTTVIADRQLQAQSLRRFQRAEVIDQLAAAAILQSWLTSRQSASSM